MNKPFSSSRENSPAISFEIELEGKRALRWGPYAVLVILRGVRTNRLPVLRNTEGGLGKRRSQSRKRLVMGKKGSSKRAS